MFGAVPAAKPIRAEIDTVAESAPSAAFHTEMQQQTPALFHAAATVCVGLTKSRLALGQPCQPLHPVRRRDQLGTGRDGQIASFDWWAT